MAATTGGANNLVVYQWNARGIRCNGHELIQYINNSTKKPHVICVQETFLPPGVTYDIPNYVGIFRRFGISFRIVFLAAAPNKGLLMRPFICPIDRLDHSCLL